MHTQLTNHLKALHELVAKKEPNDTPLLDQKNTLNEITQLEQEVDKLVGNLFRL